MPILQFYRFNCSNCGKLVDTRNYGKTNKVAYCPLCKRLTCKMCKVKAPVCKSCMSQLPQDVLLNLKKGGRKKKIAYLLSAVGEGAFFQIYDSGYPAVNDGMKLFRVPHFLLPRQYLAELYIVSKAEKQRSKGKKIPRSLFDTTLLELECSAACDVMGWLSSVCEIKEAELPQKFAETHAKYLELKSQSVP